MKKLMLLVLLTVLAARPARQDWKTMNWVKHDMPVVSTKKPQSSSGSTSVAMKSRPSD